MGSTAALSHSTTNYASSTNASDVILSAHPSQVRVFIKSLHLLAAAWIAVVVYVLFSFDAGTVSQVSALTHLLVPALSIETGAVTLDRWTRTLGARDSARADEWNRALGWAAFPIVILAGTALMMTAR
ncbi:MAG: hypothetical protein AB7F99_03495 [Vicinamibacterales bacterium]